jgi:flavin reductase (DIM6/NTAB) family NADH-FMN oxidoreductase RutF
MTEKVKVSSPSILRLLHPMHTVLVTSIGKSGNTDIITLAWVMPTSINPPLVALSISPRRHSHSLILETKEFVVNIPTMDILNETFLCGSVSGRDHDKFKESGLTAIQAKRVKPPIIKECVAHLECKLHSQLQTGDHTVLVGEVVEAYADKDAFKRTYDLEKAEMIFHMGGDKFATLQHKSSKPKRP